MTMFMIFIRWIDGIDSGQKTESKGHLYCKDHAPVEQKLPGDAKEKGIWRG